jgi:hypothetical protein
MSVQQPAAVTRCSLGQLYSECHAIAEHKKDRHFRHVAVTLRIPGGCGRPNALRDDRAAVSHSIVEEPSGSVEDVSGERSVLHGRAGDEEGHGIGCEIELKMVLPELQETSEIRWRLPCSEHSGDVAVSVQEISLQGPMSTHANYGGKSSHRLGHFWTRVVVCCFSSLLRLLLCGGSISYSPCAVLLRLEL